jgi:hypothetical protein
MILTGGRSKYSIRIETCPRAATTNPIWSGFGLNLGLRCKRPATNCLSHWQTEGKRQVVLVHAIKAYEGNWIRAPCILNFGTVWMWVVSFTPRPLYHFGKRPRYSLNRRLEQVPSHFPRHSELHSGWCSPLFTFRTRKFIVSRHIPRNHSFPRQCPAAGIMLLSCLRFELRSLRTGY